MIELNLTYEESKRILELGYDFSKVCWKSLYKYRDQYNLNRTFIKIHIHGTHLSLASIEDEIKHRMSKYGIVDLVTPIIPKAALEDCLPRNLNAYPFSSHLVRKLEKFGYRRNGKEYSYINFDSAFEAFIWLYENYPEELKKKFDEVMA